MKKRKVFTIFISLIIFANDAFAMHITEGILPLKESVTTFIISLPFVLIGFYNIYKMKKENPFFMSLLGLVGASIFVVSAFPIPVPIAGTCSHPAGTGLGAVILGPFVSTVVACVSLLIQALFMAHGGLTTLGANTLTMGVFGSFLGFVGYKISRKVGLNTFISGFVAGFVADISTYAATAVILALSLSPDFFSAFKEISYAFVPTQVPLGVFEGIITGYAVRYISLHKPELMEFGRVFIGKYSLNNR